MIDFTALAGKLAGAAQLLGPLGQLVQQAHALAPAAPGLAKASLVVSTISALEPEFAQLASELTPVLTDIVSMYRATGVLPTSTATK